MTRRLSLVLCLWLASARILSAQPTTVPAASTSGALTATGSVTLTTSGYGTVAVQISGTFVATTTFEGSVDGTNYNSLLCSALASGSTVTTATAAGVWVCGAGGLKSVRGRVSAYTSGTVTISLQTAASGGGGGGGGGGASGAVNIADPTTPSQKAAVNASGQLSITCANCSGSGASAVDESTFTQGTNSIAPSGGLFTNSYSALTSGQAGVAQITSDGAFFVNETKLGGTAIDTNSGSKSAGTQRIVIATDQPQLTNALKVDPSAVTSPVSVSSLPLPAGAATAAKQPALGTAGTASSDVITVQGAASMTKLLVTPDLPSGASTAAKQPALGTAGSASTDVLTVQGISSMTALKVDGSAVTQPISAASLPLPSTAATSTKQSDGSQKTQIVDGSGNVIASTSNNLNVQCANCSGSGASAADEASFTAGTSTFAPSGGFFQTTATNNALTNGQQGMFQATAQRALFTNLRNASGTEVGTSTTPLQVSLANTGANSTAVKVDGSAVTQPVSLAANQSVNMAQVGGTNTVTGGVAGTLAIGGTVANNVAITANPINLGAQAVSSENSAVTTARQVQLVADLVGKLITLPYANPENFVSGVISSAMTGTTSTSLIASPGGSLRNYITGCVVSNSHATVGTDVLLQDGSGGTTLWVFPAAALYGGTAFTFVAPLRQPTTATALYAQNVTTGASVKISCNGYKGL